MNQSPWNSRARRQSQNNGSIHCSRPFTVTLPFALKIIDMSLFYRQLSVKKKCWSLLKEKSDLGRYDFI